MEKLIPSFTKRKYGKVVFTWIYFLDKFGNIFTPIQDPYQGIRPKEYIKESRDLIQQGYYYENEKTIA